jgi:TrmH family RNA methyltransferase
MKQYETISSLQNSLVKKVVELKNNKRFREKEGLTLVEGKNLLLDLLKVRPASMLFVTEEHLYESGSCDFLYLVTPDVMRKMSTVETPEGMLALLPIQEGFMDQIQGPLLILDGLQDPGNVGTLLRTASAFGVKECVSIEPSVDLWHPKVMRSSKGAHYFFSSLFSTTWDKLLPFLQGREMPLLVATIGAASIDSFIIPQKWALVIGSESRGPTLDQKVKFQSFSIPMQPHINSLNAAQAGAISLYYCTRGQQF